VRKARYEKPSEVVRGFNPDVERFIARALRADRSKRFQSAEQMADRIDALVAKLGQPSGPNALKRWLGELAERDGIKAPAETQEEPAPSGTIELGSRDLELQQVSPPVAAEPEAPRPPTPAKGERPPPLVPPAKAATRAARAAGTTRVARMGRWLRRATLGTLLVIALIGGAAYFARPHLPAWINQRVDGWIRSLPPPIGEERPATGDR
jgi:hypothetical protein